MDGGRSEIAEDKTIVSVDVLTESERPSENPESWRGGAREGRPRGGSIVFARGGAPVARGNAGVLVTDCGVARRMSGRLFFATNEGREGLDSAAYEALRMCCDWFVPNTLVVSSSEETELSGVGK